MVAPITSPQSPLNNPPRPTRWILPSLVLWTVLLAVSFGYEWIREQSLAKEHAKIEASTIINQDLLYRQWATSHGGLYVPPTDSTPANPYLHAPDRDVVAANGKHLTLINPSYMARQVHSLGLNQYGVRGHITSLQPINPINTPDSWEAKALQSFENGMTEASSVEEIDGKPYLRLMRPLRAEAGCLKCHGERGKKLGDICGGMSENVPMAPYLAMMETEVASAGGMYGLIWLTGIVLGLVAYYQSRQRESVHMNAVKDLLQQEEQFRWVIRTSVDGFWVLDEQARFIEVNDTYCRMIGYSREELLRMHVSDIEGTESPEETDRHRKHLLEHQYERFESQHRRKDGTRIDVEVSVSFEPKFSSRMYAFVRDITEQKRAEQHIHQAEKRFRSIFESSPFVVVLSKINDGTIVEINKAWLDLVGYSREAVLGRTVPELGLTVDMNERDRFYNELQQKGFLRDFELQLRIKSGAIVQVLVAAEIIDFGNEQCLLTTGVDISLRKKMEEDLVRSEERYQSFILNSHEAIYCMEFDSPIDTSLPLESQIDSIYANAYMSECNNAMARMYGFGSRAELVGKRLSDLHGGKDNQKNRETIRSIIRSGYSGVNNETEEQSVSGKRLFFRNSDIGIFTAGKLVRIWGTAQDVTNEKAGETKLKDQLQELQRWQEVILGREERIHELKREVNQLRLKLGEPPAYQADQKDAGHA